MGINGPLYREICHINYSLPLVWNESIAGNQHNLGKFGRVTVSGVTGGGKSAPWHFSLGNFWWPTGKREAMKNEKMGKKRVKRSGKLKMEGGKSMKVWKLADDIFFFGGGGLFTFWNHRNLFGSTKTEISTGKKHSTHREKIRKSDFAPSEKIFLLRHWSQFIHEAVSGGDCNVQQ